jgi:hypothetical protein
VRIDALPFADRTILPAVPSPTGSGREPDAGAELIRQAVGEGEGRAIQDLEAGTSTARVRRLRDLPGTPKCQALQGLPAEAQEGAASGIHAQVEKKEAACSIAILERARPRATCSKTNNALKCALMMSSAS